MVPANVIEYLEGAGFPYAKQRHRQAYSAQEVASSLGISGYQVAKGVMVEADGDTWMALLPAPEVVDPSRLAAALGANAVRLLAESEFVDLFPGCEPGAEPPLSRLYGVPVIVDRDLAEEKQIVFRAGSHDETISMRYEDFDKLEHPATAEFAVPRSVNAEAGRRAAAPAPAGGWGG